MDKNEPDKLKDKIKEAHKKWQESTEQERKKFAKAAGAISKRKPGRPRKLKSIPEPTDEKTVPEPPPSVPEQADEKTVLEREPYKFMDFIKEIFGNKKKNE